MSGDNKNQYLPQGMIPISIAFVFILLFLSPLSAQELNFRIYGSEDGIHQSQIVSICQDEKGYIWFGSYSGVSRYNGYTFKTFDTSNGLKNNSVADIACNREGKIYFATQGGGVAVYDGENFSYIDTDNSLLNNNVNDILVEPDGQLWVATNGALTEINKTEIHHYVADKELKNAYYCSYVFRASNGDLWLGTENGVYVLRDGTFVHVPFGVEVKDPYVNVILEDREHTIWVGTSSGLLKKNSDEFEFFRLENRQTDPAVISALVDSDGSIWVGSDSGLFRLKNDAVRKFTSENGLSNNSINRLYRDAQDNIWMGTEEGVTLLSHGSFVFFDSHTGLLNDEVLDVFEDSHHRILAATTTGVSAVTEGGISPLVTGADLSGQDANAVTEDHLGNIYVGTSSGLFRWDGWHVTCLLDSFGVTDLFTDREGRVWIGSTRGVSWWENEKLNDLSKDSLLSTAYINCITSDEQGRIWFGTGNKGCIVLDGNRSVVYGKAEGLSNQEIWTINRDNKGRIWIGTNGEGAFYFDGQDFTQLTIADGLDNNFVWQVQPDSSGNVWFGTNTGLDRYDGKTFYHYDVNDGLAANEGFAHACIEDSKGNLWFASGKGLSVLYNGTELNENTLVPVHIERIVYGSHSTNNTKKLVFEPFQNNLVFEFSGLYYRNINSVRYSYMVDGLDPRWSELSKEHIVRYANLPPGNYTFLVRATIDKGKSWNLYPGRAHFNIKYPFFMTWWFVAAMILLVSVMVLFTHTFRLRKLNREKIVLEHKVSERTQELEAANLELESANEHLEQVNSDLEAFSFAVSHDLKSPLARIHGYCELLGESDELSNSGQAASFLKSIRANCKRMNELIHDLLDLAFASKQKIDRKEVDLGFMAREIVMQLKHDFPNHEIDFVVSDGLVSNTDERLIKIVLENLIGNAWKFTSGCLKARIEFNVEKDHGKRVYYVRDNGVGFSPERASELFQFFKRLHDSSQFPGIGIGLTTAYRIISRLGGEIWADGEENQGATFFFTLD